MVRFAAFILAFTAAFAHANESDYYRIITLPYPDDARFEVSGLAQLPDGRIAAAIRKGEVWLLENPYEEDLSKLEYKLIATALHEPLGLLWHEGALYATQRGELTRMIDTNNDDIIDVYETVSDAWGLTGNYHEYAYGPALDKDGYLWVTLNQTIGAAVEKGGPAPWRGWGLRINTDGTTEPMCAGMRSPCGIGANAAGDVFFTDQQGEWVPAGSLHHLRRGAFYGHTVSLRSADLPGSPIEAPEKIPSGMSVPEAAEQLALLSLPAVWFPYRKMGMSATDIRCDQSGGKFGPFEDQLFVGDFTMALINRVYLEEINGEYQGACFPFRGGFQSAIVRMEWGNDGSLFIGETNRGWNSTGSASYGFERVVWTGKTPFEIETMQAKPSGFRLTFTQPIAPETAADLSNYALTSYTFYYHGKYGSEEIKTEPCPVTEVRIANDNLSVDLTVENLREKYVHELQITDLQSADGRPLLHPEAYYTLNHIPAH